MILPDVNVLVFAFRRESPDHERYATWLADAVAGTVELALVDLVLAGFVRIVTNRRVFADPAPTGIALAFVDRIIGGERTRWLTPGPAVWRRLQALAEGDEGIRGNLVPDAVLAASALTHHATIATRDRGFARFDGLQTMDPATTGSP